MVICWRETETRDTRVCECLRDLGVWLHTKKGRNGEVVALDPELFREVDRREDGKTAVSRAASVRRFVFVLHRTRIGLEPAVEKVVEARVLRDIWFE